MIAARIESINCNTDGDGWVYNLDGELVHSITSLAKLTLVIQTKDLANINPERPVTLTQCKDN